MISRPLHHPAAAIDHQRFDVTPLSGSPKLIVPSNAMRPIYALFQKLNERAE